MARAPSASPANHGSQWKVRQPVSCHSPTARVATGPTASRRERNRPAAQASTTARPQRSSHERRLPGEGLVGGGQRVGPGAGKSEQRERDHHRVAGGQRRHQGAEPVHQPVAEGLRPARAHRLAGRGEEPRVRSGRVDHRDSPAPDSRGSRRSPIRAAPSTVPAAPGAGRATGSAPPASSASRRAPISVRRAAVEQLVGDRVHVQLAGPRVVGRHHKRWGRAPQGLEEGVEVEVGPVLGPPRPPT